MRRRGDDRTADDRPDAVLDLLPRELRGAPDDVVFAWYAEHGVEPLAVLRAEAWRAQHPGERSDR